MNEELLIGLVRQYPELFDPFDKKYHDELRRNSIWCDIGRIMKENPANCKARWKRIRDNFRRAKTLRKSKISQGSVKFNKPAKYEEELAFLNPFIRDDDEKSRTPTKEKDEPISSGSHETGSGTKALKMKKTDGTPIRDLLQTYIDKIEHNPEPTVVDFFTNLGRTVHTFPEDVQIRVKGAVFKLVNDAEAEVLQRRHLNPSQSVMLLPETTLPVQPINATSPSSQSNKNYYTDSHIEFLEPKMEGDDICDADSNID